LKPEERNEAVKTEAYSKRRAMKPSDIQ